MPHTHAGTDPPPTSPSPRTSVDAGSIVGTVITVAVAVTGIIVIILTTLVMCLMWRNKVKCLATSEPMHMYEKVDPPVHAATSIATPTPSPPLGTSGVEVELQENQCYVPFAHRQIDQQENPCHGPSS